MLLPSVVLLWLWQPIEASNSHKNVVATNCFEKLFKRRLKLFFYRLDDRAGALVDNHKQRVKDYHCVFLKATCGQLFNEDLDGDVDGESFGEVMDLLANLLYQEGDNFEVVKHFRCVTV